MFYHDNLASNATDVVFPVNGLYFGNSISYHMRQPHVGNWFGLYFFNLNKNAFVTFPY